MAEAPSSVMASSSYTASEEAVDYAATFLLDNIPPMNFELPPIKVPWMGGDHTGTSSTFLDMPADRGYDMADLERGSFGSRDEREGLAFLQDWLFFGLLREVVGDQMQVNPNDWIGGYDIRDGKQKYMMSPRLQSYVNATHRRLGNNQDRPSWEHWDQILGKTSKVVDAFDMTFAQRCRVADAEQEDALKITWSIYMLGQILSRIIITYYRILESDFKGWSAGALLYYRLTARLECPHRCNKIATLFAVDGVYVMSLLSSRRPMSRYTMLPNDNRPDNDSGIFLAPSKITDEDAFKGRGRHWRCTYQRCLGEGIDESSYRTVHSPEDCRCGSISPKLDDVIKILDASEVPAFVVREKMVEGRTTIAVEVVRAKTSAYVAFSHVWADGLGNKKDNSLPKCQVARLARFVEALTGREGQPFWIDTFGIPRELEQRKKALKVMDMTYRFAEKVLVLDSGLQQHTCYPQVHEQDAITSNYLGIVLELSLRIVCCTWTSRLWTLPEGMLGPELHFQFSDGAVELGELSVQLRCCPYSSVVENALTSLALLRPSLWIQPQMGLSPINPMALKEKYDRFVAMFQVLQFRDTSWKEDEATCLGIHLELDLPAILAHAESERLEALFAQLSHVPADLIFTHGERNNRYPYRWAPLHLLEFKDNFLCVPGGDRDISPGAPTDRGLLVCLDYFTLHTKDETVPMTKEIYFSIQTSSESGISGTESYCMGPAARDGRLTVNWRETKTHQALSTRGDVTDHLYVILGPSGLPGPYGLSETGQIGLLMQKVGEEDGVIYGKPLDTVKVYKMSRSGPVERKNSDSFVHWAAEKTMKGQICIG